MIMNLEQIIVNMNSKKCCDNCIYYSWYYDYCKLWNVEIDARSICNNFIRSEKNDSYTNRDSGNT